MAQALMVSLPPVSMNVPQEVAALVAVSPSPALLLSPDLVIVGVGAVVVGDISNHLDLASVGRQRTCGFPEGDIGYAAAEKRGPKKGDGDHE